MAGSARENGVAVESAQSTRVDPFDAEADAVAAFKTRWEVLVTDAPGPGVPRGRMCYGVMAGVRPLRAGTVQFWSGPRDAGAA